eukprot:m.968023 g.968023  ORF g.968023 m.968023 type:complete len:52 (-) comp23914_c0_seq19:676-831(-)
MCNVHQNSLLDKCTLVESYLGLCRTVADVAIHGAKKGGDTPWPGVANSGGF